MTQHRVCGHESKVLESSFAPHTAILAVRPIALGRPRLDNGSEVHEGHVRANGEDTDG